MMKNPESENLKEESFKKIKFTCICLNNQDLIMFVAALGNMPRFFCRLFLFRSSSSSSPVPSPDPSDASPR